MGADDQIGDHARRDRPRELRRFPLGRTVSVAVFCYRYCHYTPPWTREGRVATRADTFFVFVLQIPNHGGSSVGYETRSEPETRAAQRQLRLYESPDGVARIHGTCVGVTNNDD